MATYETFPSAAISGLDVEQSKRLRDFLASRYDVPDQSKVRVPFDDRARDVLLKYVYDPKKWKDENRYLDSIGYGCRRVPGALEKQIFRFDKDPETGESHAPDFRWNKNFKAASNLLAKQMRSEYGLEVLEYHSDDDIKEALPKLDTHSGYAYLLDGKKYKGDRIEGSFSEFEEFLQHAFKTKRFDKPILSGYRLQISGAYLDDLSHSGTFKQKERLVSMVDVNVILCELMFAKGIQAALGKLPFYGGAKSPEQLATMFANWRDPRRSSYWYSFDYSHYDQSIPAWLIEEAFKLLKKLFLRNRKNQKWFWLWDVIVHEFIHKSYVIRGGRLFWVHNGVPSGSMFTQIVDTICNILMVYTYLYSIGKDPSRIFVNSVGDDVVLFVPYELDVVLVSSYLKHNFGIDCNPDKCGYGSLETSNPHYLSREWRIRGAYRAPVELFAKMLYPEKRRPYDSRPEMSPELVIYSYILAYPLGMREFMNVDKFLEDCSWVKKTPMKSARSYITGYLSYAYEYGLIAT